MSLDQTASSQVAGSAPALPLGDIGQVMPTATAARAEPERQWFWRTMWKREHAEVTGLYLDIFLRLLMCAALVGVCYVWLDRVSSILERQCEEGRRPLSDAVLIALLTTTTANVLGLLLIVVGYLFPKRIGNSDSLLPPPD